MLGFGAMGLAGWFGAIHDRDAIRALHTALDLGVNMIDTARDYGRSEQVVGAGLRSWSGTKPFVATKIQPRGPKSQYAIPPAVEDVFPKGWVTQSCETSLRELGLDHVDLMHLHLYWPTWGQAGYWMDELQALRASGKARSVGISVPDHRHDMVISLVQSGLIDSVQTILNVFANEPLDTLIPICQAHDVAVIARCILDEGGLTGFLTEDLEFPLPDELFYTLRTSHRFEINLSMAGSSSMRPASGRPTRRLSPSTTWNPPGQLWRPSAGPGSAKRAIAPARPA